MVSPKGMDMDLEALRLMGQSYDFSDHDDMIDEPVSRFPAEEYDGLSDGPRTFDSLSGLYCDEPASLPLSHDSSRIGMDMGPQGSGLEGPKTWSGPDLYKSITQSGMSAPGSDRSDPAHLFTLLIN